MECPFCNSKVETYPSDFNTGYYVKCFQCGLTGPQMRDEIEAVEVWNRIRVEDKSKAKEMAEFMGLGKDIPGSYSLQQEKKEELVTTALGIKVKQSEAVVTGSLGIEDKSKYKLEILDEIGPIFNSVDDWTSLRSDYLGRTKPDRLKKLLPVVSNKTILKLIQDLDDIDIMPPNEEQKKVRQSIIDRYST